MKSKAIFTFLFGIIILSLQYGTTVARSCESLTGKCSTPHCGNGLTAVAYDTGQIQYCCIAGASNKMNPAKKCEGDDIKDRFDGNKTSCHYKTVRHIVWGQRQRVALYTKRYNEYLYAYYKPVVSKGESRRKVHTWRPGDVASKKGFWVFESNDGGETFLIKNVHYGEYLYAYDSKDDKDMRYTYTRKPPCDDKSCLWQIEYVGDNEIRIMNAMYPEYLVAAGDSFAREKDRPENAWLRPLTLDDRIWKVVLVE